MGAYARSPDFGPIKFIQDSLSLISHLSTNHSKVPMLTYSVGYLTNACYECFYIKIYGKGILSHDMDPTYT